MILHEINYIVKACVTFKFYNLKISEIIEYLEILFVEICSRVFGYIWLVYSY